MTTPIRNKKILITGGGGMMGRAVAESLAKDNEVWATSLFNAAEAKDKQALEAQGVRTYAWDMAKDDLGGLPSDFTHVLHTAMLRDTDSYDDAVEVNSISAARLMTHCRSAEAFIFVSTVGVYQLVDRQHAHKETDPQGTYATTLGPYVIGKIASEGVVRALARLYELPTTIVRPNVVYGPYGWGGVPIMFLKRMMAGEAIEAPQDGENWMNLIHTDDIARFAPGLWAAASYPATVVNLGGDENLSMPQVLGYLSELTGVPVKFVRSPTTRATLLSDNTRRLGLVGECQMDWREGLKQVVEAHLPGLVKADA